MNYLEITGNARQFRDRYNDTIKSALLGHGVIEEILANKFNSLHFLQDPSLRAKSSSLYRKIKHSGFCFELPKPMQTVGGRLSPLPKKPNLLDKALPCRPTVLLKQLFTDTCWSQPITQILDDSEFSDSDLRYRCVEKSGRMTIGGSDTPTVGSLAAIAHELGHCLFETYSKQADDLGSETFAMTFEEVCLNAFLKNEVDRQTWQNYQRQIDQLNYFFFAWEQTLADPTFAELPQESIPDVYLSAVRESFVTKTGYQAIYAQASIDRQDKLNKLRS